MLAPHLAEKVRKWRRRASRLRDRARKTTGAIRRHPYADVQTGRGASQSTGHNTSRPPGRPARFARAIFDPSGGAPAAALRSGHRDERRGRRSAALRGNALRRAADARLCKGSGWIEIRGGDGTRTCSASGRSGIHPERGRALPSAGIEPSPFTQRVTTSGLLRERIGSGAFGEGAAYGRAGGRCSRSIRVQRQSHAAVEGAASSRPTTPRLQKGGRAITMRQRVSGHNGPEGWPRSRRKRAPTAPSQP